MKTYVIYVNTEELATIVYSLEFSISEKHGVWPKEDIEATNELMNRLVSLTEEQQESGRWGND